MGKDWHSAFREKSKMQNSIHNWLTTFIKDLSQGKKKAEKKKKAKTVHTSLGVVL